MRFTSMVFSASFWRMTTGAIIATSLCACSGGSMPAFSTSAQLARALRQDLNDYLTARSSVEHISTLSMTVSFRGDPASVNEAVGTTTYGGNQPVTPANVFQIGSNTKSFTAALLLRLEAQGKLSIDDTLGKWLPQYPAWSGVTIRQLLDMTSGIATYDATPAWNTDYANDPYAESTPADEIAYIYPELNTPGAAWVYSNTGYMLAQLIIAKASASQSFATELDALIARAGLHNTFYAPYFYPPAVQSRLVSGYYVNTDPIVLTKLLGTDTSHYSLGWAQAAGGIVSTPQDLTLWVRELFEGNVLPAKQLAELETLVAIPSGQAIPRTSASQPQGFGLGVFQVTDPKTGLFWGYQGSTIGYRAAYAYYPASGLIICVFTNSQAPAAVSTINSVLFETIYATLKAAGYT